MDELTSSFAPVPPGEWEWGPMDDGACIYSVKGVSQETIAFVPPGNARGLANEVAERARRVSYARLMASAPELLTALNTLLELVARGLTPTAEHIEAARAVVRKATIG